MNNQYHLQVTRNICQLHIDAVSAYDQALSFIDDKKIYNEMAIFQHHHIHHIENLNKKIKALGDLPLPKQVDLKGYILDGLTAVRSVTGLRNALKSIEYFESNLKQIYEDYLHKSYEMPTDIKDLLTKNYINQIEHIIYLQKILLTPFAA